MGTFPENWLKSELVKLLGFEADEIVEYKTSAVLTDYAF